MGQLPINETVLVNTKNIIRNKQTNGKQNQFFPGQFKNKNL